MNNPLKEIPVGDEQLPPSKGGRTRIVIEVDGGLVQDIYTSVPADYIVVDRDVEGKDTDKTYKDKTGEYMVSALAATRSPRYIKLMFKKHFKDKGVKPND